MHGLCDACDSYASYGERNPTSTKGRSRWKSSSENLLIAEVRFRVRFRDSKTIFHENYFWWMSNCVFRILLGAEVMSIYVNGYTFAWKTTVNNTHNTIWVVVVFQINTLYKSRYKVKKFQKDKDLKLSCLIVML